MIKFMLKCVITLDSRELMNTLRKKINFDDLDLTENIKYLIYDALKEYFQISNALITIYLDILNTCLSISNRLQHTDLLILFIIYTMPQNAKLVDKLVKNLIKTNYGFSESLFKKLFTSCGTQIIQDLFDTICQFTKPLIVCSNSRLNIIASCIYKLSYECLERKYKQIVINLIVNHAISCVNIERDNALDILYDLAIKEKQKTATSSTKLNQFAIIIKMLLDFIDYFSIQQTRKLYFIMCTLSYDENSIKSLMTTQNQQATVSSASLVQDTLYIMITKQLSSSQTRYKQMGVMGVLMMLKCISDKLSIKFSSSVLNNEIKSILHMIQDSSKNSPETMCLFYDYLNSLIRSNSLIKPIEDIIKENLKDDVKTLFRVNEAANQPIMQTQSNQILGKNLKLKFELNFGLDNFTNGALNLHKQILCEIYNKNYQYLSTNQHDQQNFIPPIIIPSLFRVISSLERKNLNELKSYLGIPVSSISEISDLVGNGKTMVNYDACLNNFVNGYTDLEKKCFLDTIFYLINWFIELINAFTLCTNQTNSEEINEKILLRLSLIIKLKELLLVFLPEMPFYKPPVVVFGLDDTNEVPFIHALLKKSKTKDGKKSNTSSKKSNKRKADSDNNDEDGDEIIKIKKKK